MYNGKFHLSPHENIFTMALMNIHYLYIIACCMYRGQIRLSNWKVIFQHFANCPFIGITQFELLHL